MGYRAPSTVLTLTGELFADTPYEGLTVRARSVSLGTLLELTKLMAVSGLRPDPSVAAASDDVGEAVGAMEALLSGFADRLESWNLETDDGAPVPADYDGLMAQDAMWGLGLVMTWMDSIGGVTGPLDGTSNGGAPSPAASLPMEPLSPSRSS